MAGPRSHAPMGRVVDPDAETVDIPCEQCAPVHRSLIVGAAAFGLIVGAAVAWYWVKR